MNIVHVLPHLGRGGAERLTIELANGQVAAGQSVTLLVGYPLPADEVHEAPDPRVDVRFISSERPGRLGKYVQMLAWLRRNGRFIAGQDVLHCHLTFGAVFASLVRRLPGRRPAIVETYHAVGMPIPKLQRWAHARLASQWDGISFMADDPYWARFADAHPQIVSRVIPVGVTAPDVGSLNDSERTAYRRQVGIPDDARLVVGTIGRLYEERQPRRYIPAFSEISRELGSDVHFLMGGDGPEREAILSDAERLGLAGQVHLPGLVRRIELPLSVMDLYVTANVGPICGVAGLQAVAAGVPVIALQLSPDYVRDRSDWIWSSREPEEIAVHALDLLRSPQSSEDLARRQRAHLEAHHSPAAMVRNFEAFYRDATEAKEQR